MNFLRSLVTKIYSFTCRNPPRKWLGTCEYAWHPSPLDQVAFDFAFLLFPFSFVLRHFR